MDEFEHQVSLELHAWQAEMLREPGLVSRVTRRMQRKLNGYVPDKVHTTLTVLIKQMIEGVLTGAKYIGLKPLREVTLQAREVQVQRRIATYQRTASIEGGLTGAGGILLGLADFPLLLTIKLKLLFDIASLYGHDAEDYKERLYILAIFQLAFSSDEHRRDVYSRIVDWDARVAALPPSLADFDWRALQQEYRDYIDLAKLAQLVPLIGAPVGYVVNKRLVNKLGRTAMNAYRMRALQTRGASAGAIGSSLG
jgi:hypothetical protein